MPDSTMHALLSAVEHLGPNDCGAFVVEIGDAPVGSVFVERNQVCWAAHDSLHRRLRALLREHVAAGGPRDEAVRRALRQHSIESLIALPQDQGEQIVWVGHRHHSYRPRFLFSPAELLVAANALLYANEGANADTGLAIDDPQVRAASFVPGDSGGLVAIRMFGEDSTIEELDELGAWAEAALGVTRGFSRDVLRSALEGATGPVSVAWQTSRVHTHTAVIESRAARALVSTLEDRKFPAVISRRAPRSPSAVRGGLGAAPS